MRVKIDLKIFVLAVLFYFTKQIQTYIMIIGFAFIHELGHLFTGLLLGLKPEKIELSPSGLAIMFKLNTKDYNKKIMNSNLLEIKRIIIALAGPFTNLIIIIISSYLKFNTFTYLMIIYSNIILIIFNLLPILPLDGGKILNGILNIFLGKRKGMKYIYVISYITIIVVTIFSSIAILYVKNIALFLIIIYLWYLFLKEEKKYKIRNAAYEIIEKKA